MSLKLRAWQQEPSTAEERLRAMLARAELPVRPMYQVSEIAQMFTMSEGTVYKLLESGELGSMRIRRAYRVDWSSLVDFVQRGEDW